LESEFRCRLSLETVTLSVPADCEHDLNYLRRESCSGGYTRYVWQEGGENDYEIFKDSAGAVVYVSAVGYVTPACDLPAGANDYGSYQAGQRPNTICASGCSMCEAAGTGAGGAGGEGGGGAGGAGGAGEGGTGNPAPGLPACAAP